MQCTPFSLLPAAIRLFYELRRPQSASTRLFECLSTKPAQTVDQESQTRGPHVAREGILYGPRCVWEYSYNQNLSYLVYSLVFESARPGQHVNKFFSNECAVETTGDDLPTTLDIFRRK